MLHQSSNEIFSQYAAPDLTKNSDTDEDYSFLSDSSDFADEEFPTIIESDPILEKYCEIATSGDLKNNQALITEIIESMKNDDIVLPSFGSIQDINGPLIHKNRLIIGDWLFNLSFGYRVPTEVFYQSFTLLDRVLSCYTIPQDQIQLFATCSLWICTKIELNARGSLDPLLRFCHNKFSAADFTRVEQIILNHCDNYHHVTSLFYLRRFLKLLSLPDDVSFLASFFCELTLLYIDFSYYKPSLIAFLSIYLATQIEKHDCNAFQQILEIYHDDQIGPCAENLVSAISHVLSHPDCGIYRKFSVKSPNGIKYSGKKLLSEVNAGAGLVQSLAFLNSTHL